jgi:hypothetical protein
MILLLSIEGSMLPQSWKHGTHHLLGHATQPAHRDTSNKLRECNMPRFYAFALTFLIALAALGCNGKEGSVKKEDEQDLAGLERQIEAKEKELTGLRAKADALRANFVEEKPAADAIPLLELLGQLPQDWWPKDASDSLRIEQAKEWYAKNAIGRRVVITVPSGRRMKFESEGNGKFTAAAEIENRDELLKKVSLLGRQWHFVVGGGGAQFHAHATGLSSVLAERLRILPADAPLEVVGDIQGVGFYGETILVSLAEGTRFKGFEP